MKKLYIVSIVIACAGLLASCNQNIVEEVSANTEGGIVFTIGISPLTRTITNGVRTHFIANDKIGISGINDGTQEVITRNQQFFFKDDNSWGSSMGAIYFPEDGNSADFYAYYPYDEAKVELTFDYSVAVDQSKNYNESDLLLAKNEIVELGANAVSLAFVHALALVEVHATIPAGETLESVEIRAIATSSVDLKTQTALVKNDQTATFIKMQKIEGDANIYRAVIPAQTLVGRCIFLNTREGGQYSYTLSQPMKLSVNSMNTFDIN